jgi:hypothetical protein
MSASLRWAASAVLIAAWLASIPYAFDGLLDLESYRPNGDSTESNAPCWEGRRSIGTDRRRVDGIVVQAELTGMRWMPPAIRCDRVVVSRSSNVVDPVWGMPVRGASTWESRWRIYGPLPVGVVVAVLIRRIYRPSRSVGERTRTNGPT